MGRSGSGKVKIDVDKDRLRLVWSHAGKRHYLYMGLPDTKFNRLAAESKARLIEMDMASGNFDLSLRKYKAEEGRSGLTIVELFRKFASDRTRRLHKRSQERYWTTLGYLERFFKNRAIASLEESHCDRFAQWLEEDIGVSGATVKDRLTLCRASWEWGIKKHLVTGLNPWTDSLRSVRVPPKQKPRPFTKDEVGKIIRGFREDKNYCYYADFVEFLLGTGCRIGEAIALRWRHIDNDCSTAWIGETYSRGELKAAKRNRDRTVNLTGRLQRILKERRGESWDGEGLIFPAKEGGYIDDHNFRNRAWVTVLKQAGVDYRMPRNNRHTVVSHALNQGLSPADVAEQTGHDPAVLYRHYLGSFKDRPMLPDLMDD